MSIYDLSFEELEEYILNNGGKKYNASQIWEWLYIHKVNSYEEMTNVKKELLEKLNSCFSIALLEVEKIERDSDVNKYLFKLDDGNYIEAVLMKHDYGNSICISSQVGCNMGCKFCESGRLKKRRDLTTGEMIRQILQVEDDLGDRISHVVVMGIGEPFDNYDNVIKMIKIINHPKGLAIGARHITVSTCGIIPKIKEFMNLDLQVNLAISLHAPNDELRSKLMPINKAYPLKDLMKVLKEYTEKTNRRLTFEYIMLKDINDSEECALELVSLIKGINSYVNLIPYNETENLEFNRSNLVQINKFYDILKKNRINVTIRREFGGNISAACGQLRSRKEDL
ncbi:MAG: 23S rRNA (adenine(2503)-C(2))-methyltransferase RlmN [Bacilli bacterium]|nr:23S rRNA (adenine(2503)-C(2))-methyltransferase RlmN [Bacilli bacterium]